MRIKQHAKILTEKLLEYHNFRLKHTDALNIVAEMYGFDNWDHAQKQKKIRQKNKSEIPAPIKPPVREYFPTYQILKQNGQWIQAQSIAKIICNIYDKCNLLIHRENNTNPLQPSFGKLMWEHFYKSINNMVTLLGNLTDESQEELLEVHCGVYTLIEQHHSIYDAFFFNKTSPFANALLWRNPQDEHKFFQNIQDIETYLSIEVVYCFMEVKQQQGIPVNVDISFFKNEVC